MAQHKEKDALNLVQNLTLLVAQPVDVVVKATLFDNQLISRGHVTTSKLLMILVDFQAWMKRVLKEMRQLVEWI